MKFNVAAQIREPGALKEFQVSEKWAEVEYGGRSIMFAAPLQIDGSCIFDGDGFTVKGKVDTLLRSECAKCTKPFDEPFSFEFDERFEKTASEDDGIYGYRGEELDLTTMIRDNVFLNLPLSSVCREDCKGLCPICGCDRNTAQCDCVAEEPEFEENLHSPLAALGTLLNEDKEV